jgi:hypothetical protein
MVLSLCTMSDGNALGVASVMGEPAARMGWSLTKPDVLFGSPSHSLIWDSVPC